MHCALVEYNEKKKNVAQFRQQSILTFKQEINYQFICWKIEYDADARAIKMHLEFRFSNNKSGTFVKAY